MHHFKRLITIALGIIMLFSSVIVNAQQGYPDEGRPAYGPGSRFYQNQNMPPVNRQMQRVHTNNEQVNIEHSLIEAKRGVFILFTRSHGTPQMISDQGVIPSGLIPQNKLGSYESTVKPRIYTTHTMPAVGVNCILIRSQLSRPHASDANRFVDETYYQSLVARHPKHILDMVISPKRYEEYLKMGMPAAFYYYVPSSGQGPRFVAIFARQINNAHNSGADRTAFYNRASDLHHVNQLLSQVGLPSVQNLYGMQDLREAVAKEENAIKEKQESKAQKNDAAVNPENAETSPQPEHIN